MSPRSKKEYLEAKHGRYKKASRKEKAAILDEFCSTYGYHFPSKNTARDRQALAWG